MIVFDFFSCDYDSERKLVHHPDKVFTLQFHTALQHGHVLSLIKLGCLSSTEAKHSRSPKHYMGDFLTDSLRLLVRSNRSG